MTSRTSLLFLAEDRLAQSDNGVWSRDASFAGGGWARGLVVGTARIKVAARVAAQRSDHEHRVLGEVVALPHYIGLKGLLATSPRLFLEVFRAVGGADAVAVRLPGAVGWGGVVAAKLRRRPVVVEVLGDVEEILVSSLSGWKGRLFGQLARVAIAWAVRQGSVVRYVTTSALQRKYPPAQAAEVFGFSDVELAADDFSLTDPDGRAILPTVVAVGTHEQPYKGHDLLIRSIARLRDRGVQAELRLCGVGRIQHELKRLAEELGVSDRVHFLGHVSPRAALAREVRSAWIFAMPSRTEGMPRALLEAMAMGSPCVGTRVGGIPEVLGDRFTVPNEDQEGLDDLLEWLLTDAAARAQAGEENRRVVRDLNRRNSAQRGAWVAHLRSRAAGR